MNPVRPVSIVLPFIGVLIFSRNYMNKSFKFTFKKRMFGAISIEYNFPAFMK